MQEARQNNALKGIQFSRSDKSPRMLRGVPLLPTVLPADTQM
jgi:hypothetical protein